jgi:hypothetical protein
VRLLSPLLFVSAIAIKQTAERQPRKAQALRGGHFNIVQIMRPRHVGAS